MNDKIKVLDIFEELNQQSVHDSLNKIEKRMVVQEEDIIWQQMSWENFKKLIDNECLYMKNYMEYSDYEEKKKVAYFENLKTGSKDRYNELEQSIYVSCWYNSKDLSDMAFNQYTGGLGGIAIGTTVKDLLENLEKNFNKIKDIERIYVANTQYISENEKNIFPENDFILPIFLKDIRFCSDNEFRVCVKIDEKQKSQLSRYLELRKNKLAEVSQVARDEIEGNIKDTLEILDKRSKNLEDEYSKIKEEKNKIAAILYPFEPKMIKYIAIKNDGLCSEEGITEINEILEKAIPITLKKSEKIVTESFRVYDMVNGEHEDENVGII